MEAHLEGKGHLEVGGEHDNYKIGASLNMRTFDFLYLDQILNIMNCLGHALHYWILFLNGIPSASGELGPLQCLPHLPAGIPT